MSKEYSCASIGLDDTQADMLPGIPGSAICVQKFDDSLNSAIHITYRNWLRSSSMHEPRDPPLKVVIGLLCLTLHKRRARESPAAAQTKKQTFIRSELTWFKVG